MEKLRPRVLYASFDAVPAPKGASTHILQTVRGIARVAEVDLLTLPGTLPAGEGAAALPPGVRHITVPAPAENFLQRALEFGDAVGERLLAEQYAVVHVRSVWEGTPARLLQPRFQYRLVYEVNGLPSVELKYHHPAAASARDLIARLRVQERALLQSAARIITQSHTTRKFIRGQGGGGERARVIPNGVDPERFSHSARPGNEPPTIVYLGTLAPWQGVAFLVDAVRLVSEQQPVTLRIAGTGRREWRKALEHQVRRLGLEARVELLGAVSPNDVPALLCASDICVAPLALTDRNVLQGCCPIKILEYMAAGRPIVAARLPAVEEILRHEETALLYKPDKPRRLTEALLRLMEDPALAEHLATTAAGEVRERFTWERHNAAVEEVYRELLGFGNADFGFRIVPNLDEPVEREA